MTASVVLPALLAAEIHAAARAAFPHECCGLLEGVRDGEKIRITALHRARNRAASPDRFEIDSADHFAAHKAARAARSTIIGCYHSHPNGEAKPSDTDLAGAEEDFLWLIVSNEDLRAFVYSRGSFTGADWVTSSE